MSIIYLKLGRVNMELFPSIFEKPCLSFLFQNSPRVRFGFKLLCAPFLASDICERNILSDYHSILSTMSEEKKVKIV